MSTKRVGDAEGGEALVPGVRVLRLAAHQTLRVEIERGAAPAPNAAVEAEWVRKRALNPRLFDGPSLSVREIDAAAGVIRCGIDSYKRLVVQPEVETGVRQLSITGVLTARDDRGQARVLLGRRSHKTRMYGGMWQNCPAGGIDPPLGAPEITHQGLIGELLREVKEESGLEPAAPATPIAVIFDETARSHDVIVPIDLGHVEHLNTVRGWEYDELRWVETSRIAAFEAAEAGRIMAITRAIFRLMAWI